MHHYSIIKLFLNIQSVTTESFFPSKPKQMTFGTTQINKGVQGKGVEVFSTIEPMQMSCSGMDFTHGSAPLRQTSIPEENCGIDGFSQKWTPVVDHAQADSARTLLSPTAFVDQNLAPTLPKSCPTDIAPFWSVPSPTPTEGEVEEQKEDEEGLAFVCGICFHPPRSFRCVLNSISLFIF